MTDINDTFADLGRSMRDLEARRQAAWRAWRLNPNGTYKKNGSRNRGLHQEALIREALPAVPRAIKGQGYQCGKPPQWHAEIWITYNALREEWLRMRDMNPEICANLREIGMQEEPDALNGYVAFDKRHAPRVPEDAGILQFVPVHGGISYHEKDQFAAVWGFDTAHFASSRVPRTDPNWIRDQCMLLFTGLTLADALWPEYQRGTQKRKVEIAEWLMNLIEDRRVSWQEKLGTGAMISLLSGRMP